MLPRNLPLYVSRPATAAAQRVGLTAVAVLAWLWLVRDLWPHLNIIATREDFRSNQMLLLGVIGMLLVRLRKAHRSGQVEQAAGQQISVLAFMLVIAGALGYVVLKRVLDINTPAAICAGLVVYGLLGFSLRAGSWLRGLPAAMLLVGVLPLGDFADVFIGYPLRALTAQLVSGLFAQAGFSSLRADTIMIFENGIAYVDVPCSGVKSLWTGGLFWLAATWIEQRAINLRWLLCAVFFVAGLLLANLLRVAALSLIGQVLAWPLLAEILHVPLGMLGFAGSCTLGWWLLRRWGGALTTVAPTVMAPAFGGVVRVATTLVLLGLAAILPVTRRIPVMATAEAERIALPEGLTQQLLMLRPGELDWLRADGADRVERMRFQWAGREATTPLTGTLLLVRSDSWRAHHKPERCFENYGLRVMHETPTLMEGGLTLRSVGVQTAAGKPLTALYWFQSPTRSTDDYGARLWDAFSPSRESWVLVTVLLDTDVNAQRDDVRALATALHAMSVEMLKKS